MPSVAETCGRIERLPVRRVVGLMSGTSVDGIDAALVEISGTGPSLRLGSVLASIEMPFPPGVPERIHALFSGTTDEVCRMNAVLGELFADAALAAIAEAGLSPADVHLIGSHGQTVYHVPRNGPGEPSSLQIGEISVIAERTGITTVGNFRPRDIAAGGEGAPLVPYVDWALCHQPDRTVVLQNIGGIANATVVTPEIGDLLAFDTGPGNMIVDAAAALATDGTMTYDEGGRLAPACRPDRDLVNRLLQDDYFLLPPPKSTGREYWGAQYVRRVVGENGITPGAQLVADMTELTAQSIHDAYARFILPGRSIEGVYLSGGGARNPVLRRRLEELLAPVPVCQSDTLGLPVDAKEAIAFAILANETICGTPANVPSATGARGPRVLGAICPA